MKHITRDTEMHFISYIHALKPSKDFKICNPAL